MQRLPFLISLIAIVKLAPALANSFHHCSSTEEVLFFCSAGSGNVSICGKPASATFEGYLQYRYGPASKVEASIPSGSSPQASRAVIYINPIGDLNGYLRFQKGLYSYTVYSFSAREMEKPKDGSAPGWKNRDGVLVERAGRTISVMKCRNGGGFATDLRKWPTVPQDNVINNPPTLKKLDALAALGIL